MAAISSYMASTKFSMLGWIGRGQRALPKRTSFSISAQQQQQETADFEQAKTEDGREGDQEKVKQKLKTPQPVEKQENVQSKNLGRELGGQWLSSVTRHVRIYAAYIDPETAAFDQSQTDKLTLILDPTDEFVWNEDTCNKVYVYFQELVEHYEGAELTEYTLRLIGSDIEHYIRKMLYDGEIKYNMDARVLNFSMGKPRVKFNSTDGQLQDVQ